ncbi:MAG: hypothetical protein QXK76_03280 [Candidatus Woesearchaeota archaeon]
MKDKTPIYMMIIVGIVAIVGITVMLLTPINKNLENNYQDNEITANVIFESTPSYSGVLGKLFLTLILVGVAGYMYFKQDKI